MLNIDLQVNGNHWNYWLKIESKTRIEKIIPNFLLHRRTNGDILELSEISLDLNLIDNAIRYKFTDAPILAVSIAESNDNIFVLVATVGSLHQLKFTQPRQFSRSHEETQSFSIFHGVCTGQTTRDPTTSLFYVINQQSASSKLKNVKKILKEWLDFL